MTYTEIMVALNNGFITNNEARILLEKMKVENKKKEKLHPTNCKNCGAVLHSNKCEYCGSEY